MNMFVSHTKLCDDISFYPPRFHPLARQSARSAHTLLQPSPATSSSCSPPFAHKSLNTALSHPPYVSMSIHTFRLPYHPLSGERTIISATQRNGSRYSYQLQLFCQLDTSLEVRRQQQMAADVANPKPEESHGVKGLGAGLSLMAAAFNTNSLARYGNDVSTEWQTK